MTDSHLATRRLVIASIAAMAVSVGTIATPTKAATPSGQPAAHHTSSPPAQLLSSQDRSFLHHAAKGSALQIALGKVAAKQAKRPRVKKFASQTVKRFSKAARKFHAIAKQQSVRLRKSPPPAVSTLAIALAADHGTLVDREYMGLIVPASMVAVNVFKQEISSGRNPKLVAFARAMLPKLERHYRMAVRIAHNPTKTPAPAPNAGHGAKAQSG
jgi:putative membrane protein